MCIYIYTHNYLHVCAHFFLHICIYTYRHTNSPSLSPYIYIYVYRERESKISIHIDMYLSEESEGGAPAKVACREPCAPREMPIEILFAALVILLQAYRPAVPRLPGQLKYLGALSLCLCLSLSLSLSLALSIFLTLFFFLYYFFGGFVPPLYAY